MVKIGSLTNELINLITGFSVEVSFRPIYS